MNNSAEPPTPTKKITKKLHIRGGTIKIAQCLRHSSMVCVCSKIAKKLCYYVGVQLYKNIIIISYITLKRKKWLIRIKHETNNVEIGDKCREAKSNKSDNIRTIQTKINIKIKKIVTKIAINESFSCHILKFRATSTFNGRGCVFCVRLKWWGETEVYVVRLLELLLKYNHHNAKMHH